MWTRPARKPAVTTPIASAFVAELRSDIGNTSLSNRPTKMLSEVGYLRGRDGPDIVVEVVVVVLRADRFQHRSVVHSPVELRGVPRGGERSRVLDMDLYFQGLSSLDHAEALDDAELLGVRREVVVDIGPRGKADRVHDQRVAFVVADRVAKPCRLRARRMLLVQTDSAYLMILHPDEHDFLRRLEEIDRRSRQQQERGHAHRPAALFWNRDDLP